MTRDLTIPEPGSRTTYELLSSYLKDQYRLLRQLPRLVPGQPHLARLAELARDLSRRDPGALFAALRRPTVGGPLRCLVNQRTGPATRQLSSQVAAQLAFELSADGVPVTLGPIPNPPKTLIALRARRTATLRPDVRALSFEDGRLASDVVARSDETNHPPVRGGLALALVDNNPQADVEAHPEKSGNRVDLGARSPQEWVRALDEAVSLVEQSLPEVAAELRLLIQQLVPVGYDPEKHLSASYQEVVGNIYLTLHPDPLTLAEALVHELSHNKLNMLFTLDRVLENAFHPLYTSPVRPDPRPLHGILLAVHAFLPVELMYTRLAEAAHSVAAHPRFAPRLHRIRTNNQAATDVLQAHAIPTERGAPLLAEITRWNTHFAAPTA